MVEKGEPFIRKPPRLLNTVHLQEIILEMVGRVAMEQLVAPVVQVEMGTRLLPEGMEAMEVAAV
jgi:hypothetical protein